MPSAAARLGATVSLTCAVGRDSFAEEALAGLREAGVALRVVERDASTGVALIEVSADGETTIVVAPGANAELEPDDIDVGDADAVLCQLEIPDAAVHAAAEQARLLLPERGSGTANRRRAGPPRRQPARA